MSDKDTRMSFVASGGSFEGLDQFERELYPQLSVLLGIQISSARDLARAKESLLPFQVVLRVEAFTDGLVDPRWLLVNGSRFRRNRKHGYLSREDSERVILLAIAIVHASVVFGSKEKALRWLQRIHPKLSKDVTPLQLCITKDGFLQVTERLYSIEHGFAA